MWKMWWWPGRQRRVPAAVVVEALATVVKVSSGGGAVILLATASAWASEAVPERQETAVGEEGRQVTREECCLGYSPWARLYRSARGVSTGPVLCLCLSVLMYTCVCVDVPVSVDVPLFVLICLCLLYLCWVYMIVLGVWRGIRKISLPQTLFWLFLSGEV